MRVWQNHFQGANRRETLIAFGLLALLVSALWWFLPADRKSVV